MMAFLFELPRKGSAVKLAMKTNNDGVLVRTPTGHTSPFHPRERRGYEKGKVKGKSYRCCGIKCAPENALLLTLFPDISYIIALREGAKSKPRRVSRHHAGLGLDYLQGMPRQILGCPCDLRQGMSKNAFPR